MGNMADELTGLIPKPLRNGRVIIGLFAVLALVSSVATVFILGGGTTDLVWALGGGIATTVIIVGTYTLGRRYGQPHSHAVAGASIMFAVVLLVAVVAELLHAAGAVSDMTIALGLGGAVVAAVVILALVRALDRVTAA